jgi:hypothetical protein
MTDRLQELLRQRASIQTHLDWLDREITREKAAPLNAESVKPHPVAPSPAPASRVQTPPPTPVNLQTDAQADDILAQYQQDKNSLHSDVRKGCLLYFFGAFAFLGLAITAFYFLNKLLRSGTP